MDDTHAVSLYMTAPSLESARTIARALVDERLVACANIVPGVTSIYAWEGAVHEDAEVLIFAKTDRQRSERAQARAVELHEYDVPCVVELSITGGHAAYLEWIAASR